MASAVICIALLVCALGVQASPSGRVVNGQDAKIGQFPYQVYLNLSVEFSSTVSESRCGGSLISDRWILTAGHCLSDELREVTMYAGALDLSKPNESQRQSRSVAKWVRHENFSVETSIEYDLGLVLLNEPVYLNDFVQTIKLADDDEETYVGKTAVISGWGIYKENPVEVPEVMQWTTVKVLSNDECKNDWQDLVHDYVLCTKYGNRNVCTGDSGGPVVADGRQIGVVSFGGTPCSSEKPSGHVNVALFNDWICKHTGLDL